MPPDHINTVGQEGERVITRNISEEMRESYLDYAMSVITARALPDVRDGLKPVHRRVLFAMHQMGLHAAAKFRKSAAVTGETMGKFHPHGDSAIYDTMAVMAQSFKTRYPLLIGQGNWGSIDGDPPAAQRYTEAKMSRIAGELLHDLEKETVDWRPNYDATRHEPVVLPAALPNLLLNGTLGIAVGMATNIPPHNLREVVAAAVHLVNHPDATTEEILEHISGPDFPTGATLYGEKDLHHAYGSGRGGVVVRGDAEIVEGKDGTRIVVTSLPYRVNKADFITLIAEHVRDKKLEGIRDLRDESAKDDLVRVVIELKGAAHPQKILNYLYRHTQLEDTFHFNMVALDDGVPRTFSLKGILEKFIAHREDVVRRRSAFDLGKARDREHILLGLKKALDHIDRVISTIRDARDVSAAHEALMRVFRFSDLQATAILEMRLQKLAGLERKKIDDELMETQAIIADLESLLASPAKISSLIATELRRLADTYGDDRRTKIIKRGAKQISLEDLIPDEESVLVLTAGGYLKRTNPTEYRRQKRGGIGVIDLNTKEEDFVTTLLTASTLNDVLFFSNTGKVYQTKMYDVPEGRRATRGKSIMNFLPLGGEERITSVLAMPKTAKEAQGLSLMMVTRAGIVKRTVAKSFYDVRKNGLLAVKLAPGDALIAAFFVGIQDTAILTTAKGQAIHFRASLVREVGRTAAGVRGVRLGEKDFVVGADAVAKDADTPELLVLSASGFGKKTPLKDYKIQGRGGSGIKTFKVTGKTGALIASRVVSRGVCDEVVAMSKKGQVIRTELAEISSLGRATQGVRVMKLRSGDSIASLVCL